jgi:hypothetical protein
MVFRSFSAVFMLHRKYTMAPVADRLLLCMLLACMLFVGVGVRAAKQVDLSLSKRPAVYRTHAGMICITNQPQTPPQSAAAASFEDQRSSRYYYGIMPRVWGAPGSSPG